MDVSVFNRKMHVHLLVISVLLSKLKDFSRSQAVMNIAKVNLKTVQVTTRHYTAAIAMTLSYLKNIGRLQLFQLGYFVHFCNS